MPPLVVIVGETASGKSAVAHQLAKQFNGEIISADSWAVYRGFDIGTAKPTAAERAEVTYHLIDVAEPEDGFSAVLFKQLATEAIADITNRGKLPFLVGGTGLYIDSILFDYGFLPSTDPDLRRELDALTLNEVLQRAKGLQLDTEGIDLGNKRRVIRLIENNGVRPTKQALRPSTAVVGLQTERSLLQTRVERRVDGMLAAGLEQEVQNLAQRYGWDVEPMKGIGYREFRLYFEGLQTIAETRERIIRSTIQLAKKQRTWFKRNKSIHWLDNRGDIPQVVELITTLLNT